MPDISKVIQGLTVHKCYGDDCTGCPYKCEDRVICVETMCVDALELINAVIPAPVKARFFSPYCGKQVGHTQCPGCGKAINSYDNPKACGMCGQMVEWTI